MTGGILLDEIKVDHDNIRDLLERFKDAHSKKDEDLCVAISNTIIREAAVHSDAEELSIYKLMEKHGMTSVAEKDRSDHQEVKQAMAEVDTSTQALHADGLATHAKRVEKACNLFLEHAKEEENDQLPRLCAALDGDDQAKAIDDFLKARKMAPTRPHPSAPQHGGATQKAAGAAAKAVDELSNVGRKFVDVKYRHSDGSPSGTYT
uniref:Hemerythrin-like domain-containing protein n=2 Tax=Kalmanozyma brasiliensis (strain GHG001) TaxID=1365824 RepID=V5EQP3_KALBG